MVLMLPMLEKMAMDSARKSMVPMMRHARVDLYCLLLIFLLLTMSDRNLFLGCRGVTRSLS